jgi:hypothetical protein
MKNLFLMGLFFALAASNCLAQTSPATTPVATAITGDYVLVRTIEISSALLKSEIIVTYGNGKTENIELDTFSGKKRIGNTEKIHLVLSRLLDAGYEIISSTGGNGDAVFTNTYFLRKKQ